MESMPVGNEKQKLELELIVSTDTNGTNKIPTNVQVEGESVESVEPKVCVRPSFDEYFLNICTAVSTRADCRRAQHGAVIVKNNRIVSTGYNAAPPGGLSCLAGDCPRGLLSYEELNSLTGGYDTCVAQHAEGNAISFASHNDTAGATIYVTGEPCIGCWKNIQAAGIYRVVTPEKIYDFVPYMRWPYNTGGVPRTAKD